MSNTVKRFDSIITRLTLMVTGILVMAVLIAGSLALIEQQRQLKHALGTKATTLVQFMAQVTPLNILSLNFVEMNNDVTKMVTTDDEAVYAIILNVQGIPLVYFFKDTDPSVTSEVRDLVKNRKPLAAIEVMKSAGRIMEVTAPINAGEKRIGSAILGFSSVKMRYALMMQVIAIGVVLFVIICLSIAMLRIVLRRILHPVQILTTAATQISSGDLNVMLSGTDRSDELGVLSRAFEGMAGQLRGLIAGLKQREDDLRRINLFQRTILDNAAYGIISTDPEGTVSSFNRAAERLLGYSADEIVGKQTPACWHDPDEIAQHAIRLSGELGEKVLPGFDVFAARPRRNLPEEKEWTFIRSDGTRVPVLLSVTALRDDCGLITGFVGMTYDLTERKRAEEALNRTNEVLRATMEAAPIAIFDLDLEGHVKSLWNTAAEQLLGWRREEAVGNFLPSVSEDDKREFAAFRELMRSGKSLLGKDVVRRRKDGSLIEYSIYAAPVYGSNGEVVGNIAALVDITERKKAEESLRRLNRQLRAISECNETLMRATDEKTLLNDICRIICEHAGYRMAWVGYAEYDEERSIRPVAFAGVDEGYIGEARLSWADTERGRGPAGMAVRSGTTISIQDLSLSPEFTPWLRSAQQHGYRSGIWLPLKDETGRVFGILLIYSSETNAFSEEEIRLLEELGGDLAFGIMVLRARIQLKEDERSITLMNFALNNVREAAFLIDEHAHFQYINDEACRLLGYSCEELLGMTVADVDPDFPAERWPDHWSELKSRHSLLFEGHHRASDGRMIPVEVSANYFEYEGEGYNLALARDISERKRAEETLREREAFIHNILDSVDEGFIVVDRDYRIVSANRAFCGMMKLAEDQIFGTRCHKITHSLDLPCFESGEDCPVKRTFDTGLSHGVMHTHTNAAGMQQYVELKSYPITDSSGTVVSVIETINDVTDRRRLEEQLRQAQKMEAIGTLAGGIAHDFNNILTAIIGYGDIVKMKMQPGDPLLISIDQILASADRAAHLTRGLLAFSRKQVLNTRPVDLNDIVKNIETLLRRIIGEDISFSTQLCEKTLVAMADPAQIEQVLMNFVTNARDAMPQGGTLTITTQEIDLGEDFVAMHGFGKPGRHALIAVSDTGQGMDARTRENIFDPFFTTKEAGKGTGLGLAIVYGIIKQHNGHINVYSEPGEGSTFKIYLPLIVTSAEKREDKDITRPQGGTETILLAEDDREVRNLTAMILKDFGYHVIEAVDGKDALDKFEERTREIDLLVLDVIMPHKSGKEAYDTIRALRPDLPALFMSGYTADIIDKKGIAEAGIEFIAKPVSPLQLLRKVRGILDRKQRPA